MREWSEWTIADKTKVDAAAGQNILQFDIKSGQLCELAFLELKCDERAWLSAYAYTVNSGTPSDTSDAIAVFNGALLPTGGGSGGSMMASGRWFAKKAIVGVIEGCTLNDQLKLKMLIRYKDLKR